MNCGHYTGYSKHATTGEWYYFNDDTVVKKEPQDEDFRNAYILFYQKKGSSRFRLVKENHVFSSRVYPMLLLSSHRFGRDRFPAEEGLREGRPDHRLFVDGDDVAPGDQPRRRWQGPDDARERREAPGEESRRLIACFRYFYTSRRRKTGFFFENALLLRLYVT